MVQLIITVLTTVQLLLTFLSFLSVRLIGQVDIKFKLNSQEAIDGWILTKDRDNCDGNSDGEFLLSEYGCSVFRGFLDTTPPKDGVKVRSGYVNICCKRPQEPFLSDSFFDWMDYTHLELKVRGDGRTYNINLGQVGDYDISWNDMFTFPLYTRGGPYWQITRIPFSRFVFNHKGRVQDSQQAVQRSSITSLGFTAADYPGLFQLEIDYIGLLFDPTHTEEFTYELYRTPTHLPS